MKPIRVEPPVPKSPQYGCAGLCSGEMCPAECMALADQITRAKRMPFGPQRSAHLLILADLVAVAMDPDRSVTPAPSPAVRIVGKPIYRSGDRRG